MKPLPATGTAVGIDAGLDHLFTLSTGEKITNPRHERRDRALLALAQRRLARKAKARRKAARGYARIRDRRRDHLHRLTSPSSKLCSNCGTLQDTMPLNIRTWTCGCGTTHDRDINTARNIVAAGRAVTACGAGVRPQRNTPSGQSATKQETPRRKP